MKKLTVNQIQLRNLMESFKQVVRYSTPKKPIIGYINCKYDSKVKVIKCEATNSFCIINQILMPIAPDVKEDFSFLLPCVKIDKTNHPLYMVQISLEEDDSKKIITLEYCNNKKESYTFFEEQPYPDLEKAVPNGFNLTKENYIKTVDPKYLIAALKTIPKFDNARIYVEKNMLYVTSANSVTNKAKTLILSTRDDIKEDTFYSRLLIEYKELMQKIDNLADFLDNKHKRASVSKKVLDSMEEQHDTAANYLTAIAKRLKLLEEENPSEEDIFRGC